MLHKMPSLELLRHELRRRICELCPWRPPCAQGVGPEAVRDCELACSLFVNLPQLRIAALATDPMLRSREDALLRVIDELIPAETDNALQFHRTQIADAILDLVGRF
jgi:hypothetical protein